MNFDVHSRTILRVVHGSHAYGTNIASSDRDVKGVCIEPMSHKLGFLHTFEQHERSASKGHDTDEVIYSLSKFAKLAADCNPNIIEVLHVDDSDVIEMDEFGAELRFHRDAFISRKAKHTFSGYAFQQLKRIKTHRAWLLDPPSGPPSREQFGLSGKAPSKSDLGFFDSILTSSHIDEKTLRADVDVAIDAIASSAIGENLPKDVIRHFVREKSYQSAVTHYEQYLNWVKTRNPARASLEAKHGYDTKHGMHLLRLLVMCVEILETGKVVVKRPDREFLLSVREGSLSFDDLLERAQQLENKCEALYDVSPLPHTPDRVFLDDLIVDLTRRYYKKHDE